MISKECLAQNVACDCRQLFLFLFDPGNLNFFFARDRFLRKVRVEQDVREQIDGGFQIRFHHVNADTHAVVAGVTRDRSPDGFDLIRDLLRAARLCSFEQGARGQTSDSIRLPSFGK